MWFKHQKGEDEGTNMNLAAAGKVAEQYFTKGESTGDIGGGVTIGGFKNPNAPTYMAEYIKRMYAEKAAYQKEHPNMEGFPYFDAKKRLEIMQDIAGPQKLARDKMDALNVPEPPIQEPELNAPPPNVEKNHWDDWLVSSLPVVASKDAPGEQAYMDPHWWATAVKGLLAHAHDPAWLNEFNKQPFGHAAGIDAKTVIDEFKEASGVTPPAEPRAPPRTPTPTQTTARPPFKPLVSGPMTGNTLPIPNPLDLIPAGTPPEQLPPEVRQQFPELQ
jgi:hypothetical protein